MEEESSKDGGVGDSGPKGKSDTHRLNQRDCKEAKESSNVKGQESNSFRFPWNWEMDPFHLYSSLTISRTAACLLMGYCGLFPALTVHHSPALLCSLQREVPHHIPNITKGEFTGFFT